MSSQASQMSSEFNHHVVLNEPMARHCSWRCGGTAARYFVPQDLAELKQYLLALPASEAVLMIGLGSNLLVRDGGFNGSVIATQGVMNQLELNANNEVYVGAGVTGAKLAKFCARQNLSGAEFFAGIPGLVGGALAMNAGAFGGETWRQVMTVETIDRQGRVHTRSADDYDIGYRQVKLKTAAEEWFVAATLRFASASDEKNSDVMEIKQLLARRAATQPTGAASCGSVFRNPEGDYAARLIESCGLKGKRIGGAVISEKHANFIINDEAAKAADIEALIEHAQAVVQQQCGIALITEVRIVGDALK